MTLTIRIFDDRGCALAQSDDGQTGGGQEGNRLSPATGGDRMQKTQGGDPGMAGST